MATAEIDGKGRLRLNSAGLPDLFVSLLRSETVTEWEVKRISIADTVVQTIDFGGVGAAKWFAFVADGNVKFEVNATTPRVVSRVVAVNDPSGAITAAKIENASGATRLVDVFIAG